MKQQDYNLIEQYMLQCMQDSAHDKEHVYRVLNVALAIAAQEDNVDTDILIAACLLHDIARKEQNENPALCHAQLGAKKAFGFLTENGFDKTFAEQVAYCISTHRFRGNNPPETLEAKILFDADKIDATGTLGIARTLLYNAAHGEPLYSLDENGAVLDGSGDAMPSFFQEYRYKLTRVYDKLLTESGKKIGEERRQSAIAFYESMLHEVQDSYTEGKALLQSCIEK